MKHRREYGAWWHNCKVTACNFPILSHLSVTIFSSPAAIGEGRALMFKPFCL